MQYDPDWYRKPNKYPVSAADAWSSIPFSEEEKALADEIRAEEEESLGRRPRRVEDDCLASLQALFGEGRKIRREVEEDYFPEEFQEPICRPDFEECPVFGRESIEDIENSFGKHYKTLRPGLPFLEGTVGRACAWYRPHHIYREDWGIAVNGQCIRALGQLYAGWIQPHDIVGISRSSTAVQLLRLAAETLVQREAYRHNLESFGVRLREVETNRRPSAYLEYYKGIRRAPNTGTRHLENALAVAHARRYLALARSSSASYPKAIASAAVKALDWLLDHPGCMPSYSDGRNFFDVRSHRVAEWEMMQRMQEGVVPPRICGEHWMYAPQLTRGIFRVAKIPKWQV